MLELTPDSDWTSALRAGDFERAWSISDRSLHQYCASGAVKHTGERHRQRIWQGEALAGRRVLIRCYHGLGDTLQFIRFAKPLRAIAREVVVWAQPELLSLLRKVEGVDAVLPLHDGTPAVSYDVDIEVMELAHALRATPQMIASRIPYLPQPARRRRRIPSEPFAVGLVWEAGNWDRRRSVDPKLLARLTSEAGARLYSLQQGQARQAAAAIPAQDIAVANIDDLTVVLMELDLIIAVDTMVAHLAGGLGAPVWTMLHTDCDWRWPASGRETVWYPTMSLFHQKACGDWNSVVTDIIEELNSQTIRKCCL
jgi:hypothetical protein